MSPQWSPDGKSLAFVSDRNGVSNIFLYDLDENEVYQLTDFYTGAQGITPLSPVLSWARAGGPARVRLLRGRASTTSTASPIPARSSGSRTRTQAQDSVGILARAVTPPLDTTRSLQVTRGGAAAGRRGRLDLPDAARASARRTRWSARAIRPSPLQPVSIVALLDSANYSLPDTSEFTLKDYRTKFTPDYVARPSIGYARDNFGRGFFGGSAISLSDILGNQQLDLRRATSTAGSTRPRSWRRTPT